MKPRGRVDSLAAAVGDVAGSLRRARVGREPRVRVYDRLGHAQTLEADDPRAHSIIADAEAMIDAIDAIDAQDRDAAPPDDDVPVGPTGPTEPTEPTEPTGTEDPPDR